MGKIKTIPNTEKKTKKINKFKIKHYPCSYCNKTFSERASRDHHLQLHSSERPFSCSLCPHTCKTKKYLAKHVRVVHKPPTNFKCDYCSKMFHYKCILDKHIVVHTNSKPHKCKECGKGFNSEYSLKTHMLIHKNLKPYKCNNCDYACRDSSTLRRHQARHMGIVPRYNCSICDKQFSKKQLLQYHVAEVHMKVNLKKIPCELCDSKFRTKKLLSIHIEVRHNRKFATTCEICGLKLANKYNMNSHLMSHVDVRPFKCTFSGCDKRYKDRSSLQKHSIIHYPDKQFPCKICGKKFTRKERLRSHKNQHVARIKNVQCDYCGVCFYNKNYLSVHILKKHSRRKRKYICDMCDFESGNKPGLIKHIKGHNMRLDKECPICTKKYKQENWLKVHLWQAHKITTTETPIFNTDVKVEPIDADGTPEFELFEIEKEEIFDELNSINKCINSEDNKVKETTIKKCYEIQNYSDNFVVTIDSECSKINNILQKGMAHVISEENDEAEVTEYCNVNLGNKSFLESIPDKRIKEILSLNKKIRLNSGNSENKLHTDSTYQNKLHTKDNLIGNIGDINSLTYSNSDKNGNVDKIDISKNDKSKDKNVENQETTNILQQSNVALNQQYFQTLTSYNINKQSLRLKEVKLNIDKIHMSKAKSPTQAKATLEGEKKQTNKNYSDYSDTLNKLSCGKRKSLAYLRATLLEQKQCEKNINTDSDAKTDSEELDQGLEYSKAVLSEDITRCMTQRKKKDSSEQVFDDFFMEHIVKRQEKSNKIILEIDKDSHSYAKSYVNKLLEKARNNNEVKLIEMTRQLYNKRIRNIKKIRPEKVLIKYLDKTSQSNSVMKSRGDNNNVKEDKISSGKGENHCIFGIERNGTELDEDKRKTSDDNDFETQNLNEQFGGGNKHTRNSTIDKRGTKDSNTICLRSDSGIKKHFNGDKFSDNIKNMDECRKIKLNTHQCYVCFKLFECKKTLLDHCKDHFKVCSTTILKKCPLCDFATNLNIVRHMKIEHDVEITIPNTRIIDEESDNGPRYCYKVNSATVTDIDVIPSVKHLNKQAYIAIDKKNRKLKDTGIARTKLVKKGNEWVVERQRTNIDNIESFILPEFDVDEILSIKINSNDYLSRMKKLYRLAKKHKKQMLFPCEKCEKICQTLCALKLHYRRHDPQSKPFKKKVWKHKMDLNQQTNKKVADIDYGKKKYARVLEIDNTNTIQISINDNRYKKPKPVVNKHKCDPELIKFYETNIKGGDVEFWQFLKIFNKMSRENVNDFDDLNEKPEFGIHMDEIKSNNRIKENAEVVENAEDDLDVNEENDNSRNMIIDGTKPALKVVTRNTFRRIIRISRRDHQRRNKLKQKLRDKIAKENQSV